MKKLRVLSLFDGMSCGQIALRDLGIPIDTYYASEVDKFAIKQTQLNFHNTIQIGDVRNIDVDKLCEDGEIDLLIGGSPCTNLSFAGKRAGLTTKENIEILSLGQYLDLKESGFEFGGQSYLFWEYMRILTELRRYNPNVLFLLENVEMGKKWERVFSEAIGCEGVHINSALVSAQNRRRIYWTNIGRIEQPEDRGIYLRDILDNDVDEKYFLKDSIASNVIKRFEFNKAKGSGFGGRIHNENGKMGAVRLGGHGEYDLVRCSCLTLRRNEYGKQIRKDYDKGILNEKRANIQQLEPRKDGKSNCITTVCKDNLLAKADRIRRITPTECARLQTIPYWYKWECSATQQYKMLGNGWTVEVIKHIFNYIAKEVANG